MANSPILIIGPAWIGDMVMAQSLFMTVADRQPDAAIDVVAPSWCLPLLERMPQVRRAILAPFGHGEAAFCKRWRLGRELARERYGQAIVLPNSWKSALVPFAARIPRRTGWRGEMRYGLLNDLRHLDKQELPLMIQRFNALACPPEEVSALLNGPQPEPALRVDPVQAEMAAGKFGLDDARPVLALCPGAEFGPAKRWPPAKFAEVAAARIAQGWQVWLFGSPADSASAAEISGALAPGHRPFCHDLTGKTSLGEAIDLLSRARLAVSNDSGLMHIAAALGIPLAAIFGSTSPDHTPPLSDKATTVRLGLECSPCFKRDCPLGHTNCLRQLPAQLVLDALAEVEA